MDITSLFELDKFNYNLLLIPKIIKLRIKGHKAIKEAKKNSLFKNSCNGILYICGNGPSLNDFDPHSISDDYLVVNDYYRFTKQDKNHPPKFYMILDESYLDDRFIERYRSVFGAQFETTYVINGLMYRKTSLDFPQKKIFYFCPWGMLFNSRRKFDFSKVHARTWNVVCEAILFAIYAGYKEIRLVGCDYSVFASNQHFYSQAQPHANLKNMLYKYCYSTEVHYEIAKYAKKHGVKIFNCTKKSLLDAYEFLDL